MKYTTVQEAAKVLGIPERTIQGRIRAGIMQADRLGRAWLIPVRELDRWRSLPPPKRGPKVRTTRYTKSRNRAEATSATG